MRLVGAIPQPPSKPSPRILCRPNISRLGLSRGRYKIYHRRLRRRQVYPGFDVSSTRTWGIGSTMSRSRPGLTLPSSRLRFDGRHAFDWRLKNVS